MISWRDNTWINKQQAQSVIEFALVLPLLVLVIVGIFELGRAFFAYIAISNAAREGVRMYTFTPDKTTYSEIIATTTTEIGTSTALNPAMLASIVITCGNTYSPVHNTNDLANCPDEQPIRETVTYTHELILGAFFSEPLMLKRSAEMMKP